MVEHTGNIIDFNLKDAFCFQETDGIKIITYIDCHLLTNISPLFGKFIESTISKGEEMIISSLYKV